MNVTDIRIRRTYEEGKLKALVSVTIDQDLAVHDIKVIEGSERLFVAMPAEKMITAYSGYCPSHYNGRTQNLGRAHFRRVPQIPFPAGSVFRKRR